MAACMTAKLRVGWIAAGWVPGVRTSRKRARFQSRTIVPPSRTPAAGVAPAACAPPTPTAPRVIATASATLLLISGTGSQDAQTDRRSPEGDPPGEGRSHYDKEQHGDPAL